MNKVVMISKAYSESSVFMFLHSPLTVCFDVKNDCLLSLLSYKATVFLDDGSEWKCNHSQLDILFINIILFFSQDTMALSTVIVRHCGYTAVINVKGEVKKGMTGLRDIVIDDLPDGGANALNLNRYVHPSSFLRLYLFYHIVHVRIPFSVLLLAYLASITC